MLPKKFLMLCLVLKFKGAIFVLTYFFIYEGDDEIFPYGLRQWPPWTYMLIIASSEHVLVEENRVQLCSICIANEFNICMQVTMSRFSRTQRAIATHLALWPCTRMSNTCSRCRRRRVSRHRVSSNLFHRRCNATFTHDRPTTHTHTHTHARAQQSQCCQIQHEKKQSDGTVIIIIGIRNN